MYKNYSSYGKLPESKESKQLIVKALLESVEESRNKDCYNFVEISEGLEEFKICIDKDKANWGNPYEDYSILIPVKAVFYYDKVLFNLFPLKEVNFTLLDDDEVVYSLNELPEEESRNLQVQIKSNEEITSKGYDVIDEMVTRLEDLS